MSKTKKQLADELHTMTQKYRALRSLLQWYLDKEKREEVSSGDESA